MPRLSLPQWLILIAFMAFYGFAVFALTRDYYLRHPAQPPVAAGASASAAARQSMETSAIPQSIAESNPDLLHQQADKLFTEQRFNEAKLAYERIIELSPDDAEAYNELGLVQFYLGEVERAIVTLKTAVAKAPTMQRNWLTLGFVSLQAGDTASGKDALERARNLDPNSDVGKEAARMLEKAGQ